MNRQVFSDDVVEKKRYWRTFAAVIHGVSVATAIKEGLMEESSDIDEPIADNTDDENGMFFPEKPVNSRVVETPPLLNPSAPTFTPAGSSTSTEVHKPQASVFDGGFPPQQSNSMPFGTSPWSNPFGTNTAATQEPIKWGSSSLSKETPQATFSGFSTPFPKTSPFSTSSQPSNNVPSIFGQPSQPSNVPKFTGKSGFFPSLTRNALVVHLRGIITCIFRVMTSLLVVHYGSSAALVGPRFSAHCSLQ